MPTDEQSLSLQDLSILNQSPLGFLAAVAVAAGATRDDAFEHAQDLVLAHGSSRRIDRQAGDDLCASMRVWAASTAVAN